LFLKRNASSLLKRDLALSLANLQVTNQISIISFIKLIKEYSKQICLRFQVAEHKLFTQIFQSMKTSPWSPRSPSMHLLSHPLSISSPYLRRQSIIDRPIKKMNHWMTETACRVQLKILLQSLREHGLVRSFSNKSLKDAIDY